MDLQYYIKSGKVVKGPFTSVEIRDFAKNGSISKLDFIGKGQSGPWIESLKIKGLFPLEATEEKKIIIKPSNIVTPPPLPARQIPPTEYEQSKSGIFALIVNNWIPLASMGVAIPIAIIIAAYFAIFRTSSSTTIQESRTITDEKQDQSNNTIEKSQLLSYSNMQALSLGKEMQLLETDEVLKFVLFGPYGNKIADLLNDDKKDEAQKIYDQQSKEIGSKVFSVFEINFRSYDCNSDSDPKRDGFYVSIPTGFRIRFPKSPVSSQKLGSGIITGIHFEEMERTNNGPIKYKRTPTDSFTYVGINDLNLPESSIYYKQDHETDIMVRTKPTTDDLANRIYDYPRRHFVEFQFTKMRGNKVDYEMVRSDVAIKFNNNIELIEREANRRKSEKIINAIDTSNDIPAVDLIGIRIYDENGKVIGGFNESNMAKSPPLSSKGK